MVCSYVIPHLKSNSGFDDVFQRFRIRERFDIRSPEDLNFRSFISGLHGLFTLRATHGKSNYTVDKLHHELRRVGKKISLSSSIMVQLSDSKTVQLTDVYSHALVKDSWAGLPFDLVFAYYEEDEKKEEKKQVEEEA